MDLGQSCPNNLALGNRAAAAAAAAAGIAAAAAAAVAAAAGIAAAAAAVVAACTFPVSCYLNLCLIHQQAEQRRRTRHADLPPLLLPTPLSPSPFPTCRSHMHPEYEGLTRLFGMHM